MPSRFPTAVPADIFKITLGPLKPVLVNLPSGGMRGMRRQQQGFTSVVQEITSNQPKFGERAGITAANFTRFSTLNAQHELILVQLPLVEKAFEVLQESLAHVDNLRHRFVTTFADAAETYANAEGGDPTLLTAYEKTIAYRAVIAAKAVKTRKKNKENKKAQACATPTCETTEDEDASPAKATSADNASGVGGKVTRFFSRTPTPPPDDIFAIDLAPLKGFLVDLPPGAMVGMRREQDGWEAVFQEITSNQEAFGERAGITAVDFAQFVALDKQYDQILAQIPLVEKAVEVLRESLAYVDNLRHRLAVAFADAAEAHARLEGDEPTLLTAYEKTIAYRSVIADKAVKTRKKREEESKTATA